MTYARMGYWADIYTKTEKKDESDQAIKKWRKDRTIKCHFMPSRGTERLVGRVQNPHSYMLWTDDTEVDYPQQIRDLRDKKGNIIEEGPFNIISIKKFLGWSEVHHLEVDIQAVLE
jgi:hypothetical protein